MIRLEDLIGKRVDVSLRESLEPIYEVTLHGIEAGGLWVESAKMRRLLEGFPKNRKSRRSLPSQKPVFFIPYLGAHQE
jgi:hypothetical protein